VLSLRELKTKLYLALISVYALESIRFYVSFACSFAFGQQGKMRGNADIIRLIARDESQHQGITVNILRNLKKDDPDFVEIMAEQEETAIMIIDEVVEQEKEWAKYLFKDGALVGMNETLLIKYLEHIANKRLKAIGFKARYENSHDPFGWLSGWLANDENQVAPQEVEQTAYLLNIIDPRIDESNLLDL
jgi:ribonucleoside-diphosphate reductase beta chain